MASLSQEFKGLSDLMRSAPTIASQSALQTATLKKKRVKDPNAPKNPVGQFMLYQAEVRQQVLQENPGIKPTEISQIIGSMWRGLSAEEKRPYEEKAKELRDIFNGQMQAYKNSHLEEDDEEEDEEEEPVSKKRKALQDENNDEQMTVPNHNVDNSTEGESESEGESEEVSSEEESEDDELKSPVVVQEPIVQTLPLKKTKKTKTMTAPTTAPVTAPLDLAVTGKSTLSKPTLEKANQGKKRALKQKQQDQLTQQTPSTPVVSAEKIAAVMESTKKSEKRKKKKNSENAI